MVLSKWARGAACGLLLLAPLMAGVALDAGDLTDVPLPKLPMGAGKIDKDVPKTLTKTKTGLKYRVLRKGNEMTPVGSDTVVVNYKGWLDNGREFDSSYTRGKPFTTPLREVVPGWTEGLQYVGEGGMIELEIPSQLGYGSKGSPPTIPGNATLHFLVELIRVK